MSLVSSGDEIFYGDNISSDSEIQEGQDMLAVSRPELEEILTALSDAEAASHSPAEMKREVLRAWMLVSRILGKVEDNE